MAGPCTRPLGAGRKVAVPCGTTDDSGGSWPWVAAPTCWRAFRNASSSARVLFAAKDHL